MIITHFLSDSYNKNRRMPNYIANIKLSSDSGTDIDGIWVNAREFFLISLILSFKIKNKHESNFYNNFINSFLPNNSEIIFTYK